MSSINIAKHILERVFSSEVIKAEYTYKDSSFLVIPGHKSPRWIVPSDPKLGKKVLAQWRPYGFFSLVKWFLFRFLYSMKLGPLLLGTQQVSHPILQSLAIPGQTAKVMPVIYVGTPGPQQKVVVTLVDIMSGESLAVMKTPLEKGAKTSLLREINILKYLKDIKFKNVPQLLTSELINGCSYQSVISGMLSERKLSKAHIDLLSTFPTSGGISDYSKQQIKLRKFVNYKENTLSVEQKDLVNTIIDKLQCSNEISLLLVHGDFSPWNMKKLPGCKLALIDWEDAEVEGLPLWDLCHFHFLQAHLFNEKKAIFSFVNNSLVDEYLKSFGIDKNEIHNLMLLYFLFMIVDQNRNTSLNYRVFLLEQIQLVELK